MLCHAAAQTTDVSVAVTRIYHWRHEVFRRHVAQAKRIFYFNIMLQKEEIYINKKEYAKSVIKYIDKI